MAKMIACAPRAHNTALYHLLEMLISRPGRQKDREGKADWQEDARVVAMRRHLTIMNHAYVDHDHESQYQV